VRSGYEEAYRLAERNGRKRRSVPPPITHTGNELRSKVFPPVRWAIPGMLAEGVTLFGGREKMGKSWLALGLCIATATGGYALGKVPVEQGESLYISLEDNERRLQDRVNTLTGGDTDLSMLHYADGWLRSNEGGTEQLDMFLTEHPDTRLAVVDTLKKIRPYTSGRRNMYDVDYEAIEPFVGLASQHNVAIVLVHHLNQNPDPADPYDAFSGSSGLTAAVEGILLLSRERGQADGYLTVDGKDIKDRQELALGWDANVCTWTIQGDAEQYKLSKARQEILHVVETADEPVTPTFVADALGKSFNAVKKTMWEMSRDGQLASTGSGRYTLVTSNPGNPSNPKDREQAASVTEVTEVTAPVTCPHGYAEGQGCYSCDPNHPYRKEGDPR
jgi:AAA domain